MSIHSAGGQLDDPLARLEFELRDCVEAKSRFLSAEDIAIAPKDLTKRRLVIKPAPSEEVL
jgi:hypothetical protein